MQSPGFTRESPGFTKESPGSFRDSSHEAGKKPIIEWILLHGGEDMNTINPGTLIPLVISILTGGLGCALLVISWKKKRNIPATDAWQPAQGTIISSEVKEHHAVNPEISGKTVFSPMVRYQYTCAGRVFTGFQITFDAIEYTRDQAEQIAGSYLPGSQVTVYYDPSHPDQAVLRRSRNNYHTVLICGLISLTLGFASLCMTLLVFWIEKAIR